MSPRAALAAAAPARTGPAVCGVAARTERGRARLRERLGDVIPATLPSATRPASARSWWCDRAAGIALYRPDAAAPHGAIALVGAVYRDDGIDDFDRAGADEARTEGVMTALLQRGPGVLASLRGEFALALWDGARLLLARDPLGQRNLFVRSDEDVHLFCSELAPLLDDPARPCQLDFESAFHYLACGLPPPGATMARGIRRIPAGHVATWEPGRPLLVQRYWTPLDDEPRKQGDQDTRQAIAAAFDRAVAARLDRGAPEQAILLSGGLDSSLIAATAVRAVVPARLCAYTIEFTENPGKSETDYARLVAEACKIRHRSVPLRVRDALSLLESTLEAAEPCSAWAAMTHRHMLRAIRADGHAHVLSGLGSDEVFGGYSRLLDHYFRWRRHLARWTAHGDVDAFDALLWDREKGRANLYPGVASFFSDAELRRSLRAPYRGWHVATHLEEFYRECRQIKPGAHLFEMMIAHECQRRIPDLLFADFEPIGRELGVRTAYPFLDPRLVELACGLGPKSRYEHRRGLWWNKMLLRGLAAERLPATIIARSPWSYTAPFADWMREPAFARPALARLTRSRFWQAGLVRADALPRVLGAMERAPAGRPDRSAWAERLWALLTLSAWYDRYVERRR